MPFDLTKPCRTRDGRAVRILATDYRDDQPIVAIVIDDGDHGTLTEYLETFFPDGIYDLGGNESGWDLVNVDAA